MSLLKVSSVQEACAKCFAVHLLKFEILQITWKNKTKNIRLLVFSFSSINLVFWCFCFVFSCGLQYFKFWYLNRKAIGASFFYCVDFTSKWIVHFPRSMATNKVASKPRSSLITPSNINQSHAYLITSPLKKFWNVY